MGVENPIKDRTFLGKKVAKLCVGVDVFWSMPSCGDPDMNEQTEEVPSDEASQGGEVVETGETDETPETSKSSDANIPIVCYKSIVLITFMMRMNP